MYCASDLLTVSCAEAECFDIRGMYSGIQRGIFLFLFYIYEHVDIILIYTQLTNLDKCINTTRLHYSTLSELSGQTMQYTLLKCSRFDELRKKM
jgi:hypothetical protein